MYTYNKDEIKANLTLEDVFSLLEEFHAEPQIKKEVIISRTICHNHLHDETASHKLYYYNNSQMFKCFTGGCEESVFDIFELVLKVKNREEHLNWEFPQAVQFVAQYFHLAPIEEISGGFEGEIADLTIFEKYDRIKEISNETQIVELKKYDSNILSHFPQPIIKPWIDEGISFQIMQEANIRYDPKNAGIIIPHYDIDNNLVGIRERTLLKENEDYGKYRPAYLAGQLYNHPLSFCLYNLNHSKDNIKKVKKAFIFEAEKATLLYRSYFGDENDISVAVCGSSFINYQAWLLINLGVEEIIIALDKQFQGIGDEEFKKLTKNLSNIHKKYGKFITISIMFDKWDLLEYKDAPIDKGKEVFLELYKRRISLY